MVFLTEYFTSLRLVALLTLVFILAACTTAREIQECSPRERSRLAALIGPTGDRLERNRRQIVRLRMDAIREHCPRSTLSSAWRPPACERIAATLARLQQENWILEGRLKELTTVVAGKPSSSFHVRLCAAGWQTERKFRRPPVKKAPVLKKAVQVKKLQSKTWARPSQPVRHTPKPIVSAEPPVPEPATKAAEIPVSAPVEAKPVVAAPPPVRAYEADSRIRLVGPSFLPAQSTPEDRPVPVHATDR